MSGLITGVEDRDDDMLLVMTRKVRVISVEQVARTWFAHTAEPRKNARRVLTRLEGRGFVELVDVPARPEVNLDEAIVSWNVGDSIPDLRGASTFLNSKARGGPASIKRAAIATKKAAQFYSGHGGKRPKKAEAGHDLNVAALYLKFRAEQPERAESWISEEEINRRRNYEIQHLSYHRKRKAKRFQKLPDAMVFDEIGAVAIEYGGQYPLWRLEDFHHWCEKNRLRYEIW